MSTDTKVVEALKAHPAIKAISEGHEPWKADDILRVTGKDPVFAYRWASKSDVHTWISKYWEVVTFDMIHDHKLVEALKYGNPTGTVVERGTMILIRIPKEVATKQDEYYNNVTRDQLGESHAAEAEKFKRKLDDNVEDSATGAYGSIQFGK